MSEVLGIKKENGWNKLVPTGGGSGGGVFTATITFDNDDGETIAICDKTPEQMYAVLERDEFVSVVLIEPYGDALCCTQAMSVTINKLQISDDEFEFSAEIYFGYSSNHQNILLIVISHDGTTNIGYAE